MQQRIVIVGAGTMGAGIAAVAARGGYLVTLVEPDEHARTNARERLARDLARAGDPGALERIALEEHVSAGLDAFLAIEAVTEQLDLKRAVFVELAERLGDRAILATNTSSLSVGELASAVPHRHRVVGLHFFNPPAAMKLVEVVATPETSDETLDAAHAFVERIGKEAVDAADTPGFIVNRVARPFYLQAMRALEREVAPVEQLDALARGARFKMGPFELMDLIGLDVNYATTLSVYERLAAERLAPVRLQADMVAQRRLGRKSGAGFYDYANGAPERLDLSIEPMSEDETNIEEVVAVLGWGGFADELIEELEEHFANVIPIPSEDDLDTLPPETTMVIDCGDGVNDRSATIAALDSLLGPQAVIFVDAYATDIGALAGRMRHPERLVGYGVLGSLELQDVVEIVDADFVSDDALALAHELFEALGLGVCLVGDTPGLFLGRVVASIVNEAVLAVQEEVASAEDIDVAMTLGVSYPIGPIEWGREIGGRRIARILARLAQAEGEAFAPSRALWVLDVDDQTEEATHAGA